MMAETLRTPTDTMPTTIRMEVASSPPDYLTTLSAAKTSKLSLLIKHHILAIDEASYNKKKNANSKDDHTLTERTVPSVLPIRTLATMVGCFTCHVCKCSIKKGYPRAVCSNCNKERRLQCTGLRRSKRETIRDGENSWACRVTNVGPSIVQRNDIDPQQTKVKDASIGT